MAPQSESSRSHAALPRAGRRHPGVTKEQSDAHALLEGSHGYSLHHQSENDVLHYKAGSNEVEVSPDGGWTASGPGGTASAGPDNMGMLDNWLKEHPVKDWRREIAFWKSAGVTHVTAHTTFNSGHHKRIEGRTAADHLAAITRYRAAVADLL